MELEGRRDTIDMSEHFSFDTSSFYVDKKTPASNHFSKLY